MAGVNGGIIITHCVEVLGSYIYPAFVGLFALAGHGLIWRIYNLLQIREQNVDLS